MLRENKANQIAAKMKATFNLTAEQSAQVQTVLEETAAKLQAIRSLRQTDRRAFRQKRRPIMQSMESDILAILDEDQAAQFRSMREEYKSRNQAGGNRNSNPSTNPGSKQPKQITGQISDPAPSEKSESSTEGEVLEAENEMEGEDEPVAESGQDEAGTNANDAQSEWVEKTLDFLYLELLKPAVQKRGKRRK